MDSFGACARCDAKVELHAAHAVVGSDGAVVLWCDACWSPEAAAAHGLPRRVLATSRELLDASSPEVVAAAEAREAETIAARARAAELELAGARADGVKAWDSAGVASGGALDEARGGGGWVAAAVATTHGVRGRRRPSARAVSLSARAVSLSAWAIAVGAIALVAGAHRTMTAAPGRSRSAAMAAAVRAPSTREAMASGSLPGSLAGLLPRSLNGSLAGSMNGWPAGSMNGSDGALAGSIDGSIAGAGRGVAFSHERIAEAPMRGTAAMHAPAPFDVDSLDEERPALRDWVHPVTGTEQPLPIFSTAAFGAKRGGTVREECGEGHCGVDLSGPRGRPVVAVAWGTVVRIEHKRDGLDGKSGRYVRIEHPDGVFTSYMHLDAIADGLKVGDEIEAGQLVGLLGMSAIYRGKQHLHFALEIADAEGKILYLDPAPFLERAQVAPIPDAVALDQGDLDDPPPGAIGGPPGADAESGDEPSSAPPGDDASHETRTEP